MDNKNQNEKEKENDEEIYGADFDDIEDDLNENEEDLVTNLCKKIK
jgi:hypothetical protein